MTEAWDSNNKLRLGILLILQQKLIETVDLCFKNKCYTFEKHELQQPVLSHTGVGRLIWGAADKKGGSVRVREPLTFH